MRSIVMICLILLAANGAGIANAVGDLPESPYKIHLPGPCGKHAQHCDDCVPSSADVSAILGLLDCEPWH